MRKLSTGQDSTLGNYLKLTDTFFGKGSEQSQFIQQKINESPNGESEEVIADEGQMLYLFATMQPKKDKS